MSSSSATAKVAQEIWDNIAYKLPAVDARSAARVFGFRLRPEQMRHSDLWNSIFQDDTWISKATTESHLNPILVGCDLDLICNPVDRQQCQSHYLILVSGDSNGDIQYQKDIFLRSLRPHSFDKDKMEVTFASGLILNIDDIYWDHDIVRAKLKRIFSYRHRQLQTAYLFWHDNEPMVRTLGPEGIAGIGGRALRLHKVLDICGLTVTRPDGHCTQYLFEKHAWLAGSLK